MNISYASSQSVTMMWRLLNTLRAGLIQAVHKKTADSHVALRGNFSAPVCSTDPVKVSKNAASLVD